MRKKKRLCVIGLAVVVCEETRNRLHLILGDYVDVVGWCLETDRGSPPKEPCDLYLATYPGAYDFARKALPENACLLLAGRFVNPSNFDRLLELPKGAKVLAVDNSLERAEFLMREIARFGVGHLDIVPYYPGCVEPAPEECSVAVSAGMKANIPDWMEIIDLGVKELTLTTYAAIADALSLPRNVLDAVAHMHMDAVFQSVRRNAAIKMHLNAIINSVDEVIVGVDECGAVTFKNNAALALLRETGKDGTHVSGLFPQLSLPLSHHAERGEMVAAVEGQPCVLQVKAVNNEASGSAGFIVSARPVSKVQELEHRVRRELKGAGLTARYSFGDIRGESPEIREATRMARRFAQTPLTVLLEGESGVGKELFAQAIHRASACGRGPFVAFNFSALPESLAESELFGHEEGAFTGARRGGRPGLFEQAHNGTIFLDEIGDASLEVQTRLLRVLEEREVRRIGGERVLPVSVRVIAATNKDLAAMIREGTFREDLFFRICACPLHIPPLRDRAGDVLFLARRFAMEKHGRDLCFSGDLERFWLAYPWPGNVRELQNAVTYLCTVVPSGKACTVKDLPRYLRLAGRAPCPGRNAPAPREDLRADDTWPVLRRVLEVFQSGGVTGLGRSTAYARLEKELPGLTGYALRKHMETLKRHNLLHAGTTRQGTRITGEGKDLLARIGKTENRPG